MGLWMWWSYSVGSALLYKVDIPMLGWHQCFHGFINHNQENILSQKLFMYACFT